MQSLRKIFFYIFVAIYFTICPLLILRMLGFIYNPPTHQFVKTGIIYVSSNPPGADVFINDQRTPERTPTVIRDLLPNNYTIRLELKGYKSWQNTIPLVARKATAIENILLIPNQWTIKPISSRPIEKMLSIGEGNTLLLWNEQTIKSLHLLKLNKISNDETLLSADNPAVSPVFPQETVYNNAEIMRFFTVEKSPFFILHIMSDERQKYLWVDVRDKQVHLEDLSDLIPQDPVKLWWEANDDKNIYVYLNDRVNRIDIKAKAIYPDIAQNSIPLPKETLKVEANIKGKALDENSGVWLEFTDKAIGLWDKNSKSLQWIYQQGRSIEQAFWANNGSAILFRDGNDIFLLDKESFTQPKVQKITRCRANSSIFYTEKTGKLYYIDPSSRLLSMITILRHKPILPKNIADTLRLKEFEP